MPYPSIKPGSKKEKKMEDCVKQVMATGKDKSSAVAICMDSINGKTKKLEKNKKGGVNKNMAKKDDVKVEDLKKDEEVKEEVKEEEKEVKETEKVEDTEVEKKEEVVEEGKETENKDEAVKEEVKKEEEVEDKKKDTTKAEVKVEVVDASESVNLLKALVAKMDEVMTTLTKKEEVKKEEDAEDEEDTANADETVAQEASESEAKKASEEVASKKDDVLSGEAELLTKFETGMAKVENILKTLDERISKIENEPAPSKVASPVVIAKSDVSDISNKELEAKVAEINKRLTELDNMRKTNLDGYQATRKADEAFDLINKKQALLSQAK